MANDKAFAHTSVTLIDAWEFEPPGTPKGTSVSNPGAANYDTSRIIRSEYPHGPYAILAKEAHSRWRGLWGQDGRYVERRLLLSAQGSSLRTPKLRGETANYVKDAYDLSCQLSMRKKDGLQVLDSLDQIRAELGTSALTSQSKEKDLRGYISQDAGWADSGAAMEWLRQQVIQTGRVRTETGYVQGLIYAEHTAVHGDNRVVRGVRLLNGRDLFADLTIVAAGSHTPRILELDTLCDVYSEVIAYIRLSPQECDRFRQVDFPIFVNADRCVFAIAPDREGFLKLGKFSHSGRIDVRQSAGVIIGPRQNRLPPREQWCDPTFGFGGDIDPSKELDEQAKETLAEYRAFLNELFLPPRVEAETMPFADIARRPFTKIRRCWYTDTPATDFIIDYHPSSRGTLFVASGGSDHAFKFLPVIGEKIASLLLQGRGVVSDSDDDANLSVLRDAWRFPNIFRSSL